MIRRAHPPFAGQWALPGGFVEQDENLESAARRELEEETGLQSVDLKQVGAFGDVDRDPRTRVITIGWYGLVNWQQRHVCAASDAAAADWFPANSLPELAFDHKIIISSAIVRLRSDIYQPPCGFDLLTPEFDLPELQFMYECILDRKPNNDRFLQQLRDWKFIVPACSETDDESRRSIKYTVNRGGHPTNELRPCRLDI